MMTPLQKWFLHVSVALLVLSGVAFAVMKYLLVSDDPYSAVSHPMQPYALSLHVLAGPLALFAVGWIFKEHIAGRRKSRNGRAKISSGLLATGLLAPMVASGYLLQVVTHETLKQGLVIVHLISGGLFAVSYAVHLVRAARSSVVARLIIIGALTLALGATLAAGASAEPPCDGVERARQVMGSLARVVICDPVDPAEAAESASAALDVFDRVDRVMSLYKPESDLSRLNRDGHSGPVALDAELIELLALSSGLSQETAGKFDVTIKPLMDHYGFYRDLGFTKPEGGLPGAIALVHGDDLIVDVPSHTARFRRAGMGVDLGGIAKGFALDRAAFVLRQRGVRRAFLDLGRNLMFVGPGPLKDGRWRAAIADPTNPSGIAACVEVAEGALSTSSVSGRISAGAGLILDPKRGFVPGRVLQATVWSESATRADAFSTALLLLDARSGRKLLAAHGDAAVIYRPARHATGPVRVAPCG
jgi:thiamine biosynthesis lipoprotein